MAELTVLFDGSCALCRASSGRLRQFDANGRIELLDLHDPSMPQRFPQVNREEAMQWMQAIDRQGHVYSGSDAWARVGLSLPGWNLVAWVLFIPGIRWLASKMYRWIARNRYRWNRTVCEDDSCRVHLGGSAGTRS